MAAHKNAPRFRVARAIGRTFLTILSVAVITVALLAVVAPRVVNAIPLTVLSGSMEPMMSPGDLLISQRVDPKDVRVGDVVTFQPVSDDPGLVTHRVTSVGVDVNAEFVFVTQGDANSASDDPITGGQVMGIYLYHLPYLGFVASFLGMQGKAFVVQLLGGVFVLAAVWFFVTSWRDRREAARAGAEGAMPAEALPPVRSEQ